MAYEKSIGNPELRRVWDEVGTALILLLSREKFPAVPC